MHYTMHSTAKNIAYHIPVWFADSHKIKHLIYPKNWVPELNDYISVGAPGCVMQTLPATV